MPKSSPTIADLIREECLRSLDEGRYNETGDSLGIPSSGPPEGYRTYREQWYDQEVAIRNALQLLGRVVGRSFHMSLVVRWQDGHNTHQLYMVDGKPVSFGEFLRSQKSGPDSDCTPEDVRRPWDDLVTTCDKIHSLLYPEQYEDGDELVETVKVELSAMRAAAKNRPAKKRGGKQ